MGFNSREILVGITGRNVEELKDKIIGVDKYKIKRVSVFLTFLNSVQKRKIYELLLCSGIKEIPLVHLRNDMCKEELNFFIKNLYTQFY